MPKSKSIVDMLDKNKDLDKLVAKYFGSKDKFEEENV